jgi:hypothetical protein
VFILDSMYCFLNLVVGHTLNPSLPLAGNILSRVVLYILYVCMARFSKPNIVPVNHA